MIIDLMKIVAFFQSGWSNGPTADRPCLKTAWDEGS